MKSYTASDVGRLLRDARLRSGISQRSLARRAGTSQSAISRIERGLEQPTVERLAQILAGLGWRPTISLERLAEHDADPERLAADGGAELAERLERGFEWIDLTSELAGAAGGRG